MEKTPSERDLHANVTLVSYDFVVEKEIAFKFFFQHFAMNQKMLKKPL